MSDGLTTHTRQIEPATVQRFVDVLEPAGYTVDRAGQVLRVAGAQPLEVLDVAQLLADRGLLGFIPVHRYVEGGSVVLMIGTTIGVTHKPAAEQPSPAPAKRKSRKTREA